MKFAGPNVINNIAQLRILYKLFAYSCQRRASARLPAFGGD